MLIDFFRVDVSDIPQVWRIALNDPTYVRHGKNTVVIREFYKDNAGRDRQRNVVYTRKWKLAHAAAIATCQSIINIAQRRLDTVKCTKEPKNNDRKTKIRRRGSYDHVTKKRVDANSRLLRRRH